MFWNPAAHSDQENLQWCWLRAVEWCHWPLFLSLAVAPALLIFVPLLPLLLVLFIAEFAWSPVRYRWVSARWAGAAAVVARGRWITGPVSALVLGLQGRWVAAFLALFWPFVVPLLGSLTRSRIGLVQVELMRQLGYSPTPDNPLSNL